MIKRIWMLAVTALSVLSAVGLVAAAPSAAASGDLVVGTGQFLGDGTAAFPAIELHINATSGPLGEAARGNFFFRSPNIPGNPQMARGTVTCLSVIGNDTVIGGKIESSNPTGSAGQGVIMEIRNNG